jgi:predicted nucleic-acid-binding Zn-ribbon protein
MTKKSRVHAVNNLKTLKVDGKTIIQIFKIENKELTKFNCKYCMMGAEFTHDGKYRCNKHVIDNFIMFLNEVS